jgi:RNA polymerase sigma factor (sigma-70 family)
MFSDKMYGICLYYTDNKEDAEDVLQDGFLKVFDNIRQLKHDNLEAWMRRIFINTALMLYRRRKFQSDSEPSDEALHDDNHPEIQMNANELMQLIMDLPTQYRLVFNLYAIEGYKHREIAEMLEITEGTCKSNLSRARALLQQKLKEAHG